jgi:glutathione S-transferase
MQIVIGTRKWSTWSLRPWLVLKHAGVPFEEILVTLRTPQTEAMLAPYSPGSLCPVLIDDGLIDGDLTVWDSLAICEYLADRLPEAGLWPVDIQARAVGRAACAQIHSGFQSLRGECSMDLSAPPQTMELTPATQDDVRKLVRLWREIHGRFSAGGPFLLGQWSIADAYWTPLATRFRTYGVDLGLYGDDGGCAAYGALLLEQPEFLEWEEAAL